MRRAFPALTAAFTIFVAIGSAWQGGPYKVLKTVKTGGLGGFDYIYADVAGRRLYIPRGAQPAATPPVTARITVFDLDTLAPAGGDSGRQGQWRRGGRKVRPWIREQ